MKIINITDKDIDRSVWDKGFRVNICGLDIDVGSKVVRGNAEGVILKVLSIRLFWVVKQINYCCQICQMWS